MSSESGEGDRSTQMETKKLTTATGGSGGGSSPWEDLSPEVLALIFVRIPADEMSRCVPLVCRSWREVVAGPYCWADVDVASWCCRCADTDAIDNAVRKLVRRSRGTLRSLSAYKLGDPAFYFIANFGRCLNVLKIPLSRITDKMVAKHAASLSRVTELDISLCSLITSKGIHALGQHCKSLRFLRRNMFLPLPKPGPTCHGMGVIDDGEAMAIACTMLKLIHLELAYGRFGDLGLQAILLKCRDLRHLDIRGCCNVSCGGDLELRRKMVEVFIGPEEEDYDTYEEDLEDEEDADSELSSDSY